MKISNAIKKRKKNNLYILELCTLIMNIVRSFSTQKLKFFCIIVFLVLAMASSDIAAFQSVFNTQQIKLKDVSFR